MKPTLVVLAAGMGSRYGGLKQIDPVGPAGETVLDYGVFDAQRAGFGRVVFVIRREFEAAFREAVGSHYAGRLAVDYAFQSVEDLPAEFAAPPPREKPWGTGHAVWCARRLLDGPFAVVNADDFYGRGSLDSLAGFLRGAAGSNFALVGFRLANTLSEFGGVSRGVCRCEGDRLASIAEEAGIVPAEVGPRGRFTGGEIVSMNCWGFTPALLPGLEQGLGAFLAARGADPKAEFHLPAAVSELVAQGRASVRVLPTGATWFGVTHREDRPRVAAALARLAAAGEYPTPLF